MIKTGIDIIQISRLEEKVKNPNFASRIFTEIEMESDSISSLAGKFALKEAFFKATQIKLKRWTDIEVKYHENRKPYLVYDKNLVDYEIAIVVILS